MKSLDQITHKVYVVDPNGGPAVPRNVIFPEELQEVIPEAGKWETVKEWEERTGFDFPEDGAVWVTSTMLPDTWGLAYYNVAKRMKRDGIIPIPGKGQPPEELKGGRS